uniref:NADH-ubiquinone oxidoreductase chain 1 n=1 Tax=Florometra serratissima TaxID=73431 RepID=O63587_9ECHI|nr:NADH dehydrogenase subunit 1 [Florometra serratissima]AAD05073.1 NADH dehydrogenase subunit 1 [Florometra serratissima]
MNNNLIMLINIVNIIIPILIAVAFIVLIERKILGYMQLRKGPSIVGPSGTMQTIADGIKLFIKENLKPSSATPTLFFLSPALFLLLALILWTIIPCPNPNINVNLSLILILGISSLSVYSLLGTGWASNSKYSLIGGIRAVAQTISYEISISIILLSLIILTGTFNLNAIINAQNNSWLIFSCIPLSYIWYISSLAETNRTPFDLTEGESELVSGYNVEYAGGPFALFFLAEYANIIFINLLSTILFLGGNLPINIFPINIIIIAIKTSILSSTFLWVRASFPRFRYDQLMFLTWKSYLPFSISFLLWNIILINSINNAIPNTFL